MCARQTEGLNSDGPHLQDQMASSRPAQVYSIFLWFCACRLWGLQAQHQKGEKTGSRPYTQMLSVYAHISEGEVRPLAMYQLHNCLFTVAFNEDLISWT